MIVIGEVFKNNSDHLPHFFLKEMRGDFLSPWCPLTSTYTVFSTKGEVAGFIRSHLSEFDWYDFCLDRCPLYVNKKFVRLDKYIARNETRKRNRK